MTRSTAERMADLSCDNEHLKRLVVLWAENTLIHQLAARLLAVMEAATPIYQIWDDGRWYDAEERIWRETYNEFCESQFRIVYTAPPATAVPDFGALTKLIVGRLIDCGTANDDSIADAEVFVYNACRAAMLQPVSQGYKLVPVELTAENGAKSSLIGEFTEVKYINCPECFGDSECESCDGSGRIKVEVPVTWTTIKAIWKKGIEHFDSLTAAPTPTNKQG